MDWLIQKTKPIPAGFEGELKKNIHHVILTFDDGFASVIKNALPVLASRNIHATLFIPSGQLGQHPGWCKDQDFEDRLEIIATSDQLRSLNKDLVTVGSHTRNHANLVLLNKEDAEKEICGSKKDLEAIIGQTINLFAFPGGWHNQFLVELARNAGYRRLFTILPKLAFAKPNEFVTGRVVTSPQDWFLEFKLKAMGAYRWEPIAYAMKSGLVSIIKKTDSMPTMRKKSSAHRYLKIQ
jgi:peptidoglycan/xylan/chitin deacetylase (PgdA/CDA1 family)